MCSVAIPFTVFLIWIVGLRSLVGFVYPAFKSLEAVETKRKGDYEHWLVYWVIFNFLGIFNRYWYHVSSSYAFFEIVFLLWAMLPETKGAQILYDEFLKDFMKKIQNPKKDDSAIVGDLRDPCVEVTNIVSSTAPEDLKKHI